MLYNLRNLRLIIIFSLLTIINLNQLFAQTSVKTDAVEPKTEEKAPIPENGRKKNEVQLSFSNESLTNGFGNWRTASLDFKHNFDNRNIVYGSFQVSRRNEFHDRELMLGVYAPINKKWSVNLEGTVSPTHKFVGKYSATAKIERILPKGFVLSAGVRRNQYNIVRATSELVTLEKYYASYRAAYTLNVTQLQRSGTSAGHRFSFNKYYGEENSTVGANFSVGSELENIGTRVLQSNTWSVGFTAKHWFNSRWGISGDAILHRQGKIYYRRGLNFGIRYRF